MKNQKVTLQNYKEIIGDYSNVQIVITGKCKYENMNYQKSLLNLHWIN